MVYLNEDKMTHNRINLVYFSATSTTKKIMQYIAEGLGIAETEAYDITKPKNEEMVFDKNEIVVFGFPVYAGRIPQVAVESLKSIKGNGNPAIIVCVYGNRDFDDALLELHDIVTANHFKIISAGAFVAQHSIFPKTGQGRPDEKDRQAAIDFGRLSMEKLSGATDLTVLDEIKVKGNFPYKQPGAIPIKPKANSKCNSCGTCVHLCPVQAIDPDHPRKTNKELCISCARCIFVCPVKARHFGGLLYWVASRKFTKAFSERKEPYIVY